ncbi:MAG TPA: hypothetical protein VK206_21270 [Anaerolineales bacterium]|nr:hypothetical protein [Anaerolineales bacterium]HLO31233.1 hypothetical protein [Anaerolineales bacterium]
MQNSSPSSASTRNFERFLAVIAVTLSLIISVRIWLAFSQQQPMWPLPDLYLLEMLAASTLAMLEILGNGRKQFRSHGILTWIAVGILLAFVVIGAWSIGFFFAPVAGLLAIAAIWSDRRHGRNLVVHLGIGLAAALVQAALMLAVIHLV